MHCREGVRRWPRLRHVFLDNLFGNINHDRSNVEKALGYEEGLSSVRRHTKGVLRMDDFYFTFSDPSELLWGRNFFEILEKKGKNE